MQSMSDIILIIADNVKMERYTQNKYMYANMLKKSCLSHYAYHIGKFDFDCVSHFCDSMLDLDHLMTYLHVQVHQNVCICQHGSCAFKKKCKYYIESN